LVGRGSLKPAKSGASCGAMTMNPNYYLAIVCIGGALALVIVSYVEWPFW
jgi:hypothetical protein